MKYFADIVVPKPFEGTLTYEVPEHSLDQITRGSVVEIPFRRSKEIGFVLAVKNSLTEAEEKFKIKAVSEVLFSQPVFNEKQFKFFQWVSSYYQLPLGEVFYSAFPKAFFKKLKKPVKEKPDLEQHVIPAAAFQPTEDQKKALIRIEDQITKSVYHSFLLFGITGSGKTEVYIEAAKKATQAGKTALILVPEIALTPQLRERFVSRFGDKVALLHSGLSEKQRREYWSDLVTGKKTLALGARSALFAPLQNIGLIVVDEEHEPSYKQEDRVRYNARDLALVRGQIEDAVVILGSATPSIESFYAATKNKYELLELRQRPGTALLPQIQIIDMKEQIDARKIAMKDEKCKDTKYKKICLSEPFIEEMKQTITRDEQCILFVNRKGYSNFLLCRDCGDVPKCLNCSVSMTFYKSTNELKCHYCALVLHAPNDCNKCFSRNLDPTGFGTEQVEQEVKLIFPDVSIGRLDATAASSPKKLEEILDDFRSGKTQILIGTQMIAKGHDFPNVTFVGVVLADVGLHLPDFRASERTFQLLTQVAGRAGRAEKPGKVFFQTFLPDHYSVLSSSTHNYRSFYEAEIEFRKECGYPPFVRMAQIEFRSLKEETARSEAEKAGKFLARVKEQYDGTPESIDFLGPSPASISKIANQYRWHILVKAEKTSSLNAILKTLKKNGVRLIDVDPVSTL